MASLKEGGGACGCTYTHTFRCSERFGVMRRLYGASCPRQPHRPLSIGPLSEPSIRSGGYKGHGDQDVVRTGMRNRGSWPCFTSCVANGVDVRAFVTCCYSAAGWLLQSESHHFHRKWAAALKLPPLFLITNERVSCQLFY